MEHIQSSQMYSVIPVKIREVFEKMQHVGVYAKVELPHNKVAHIYIAEDAIHRTATKQFDLYIRFIVTWLKYASEIASPKCATELHAYFLLTDLNKTTPDVHSDPIDVIHANTAFTTSCSEKNTIVVFRREEWFKVFLHETFHCMGLDFSDSADDSNSQILNMFKAVDKRTDVRLYETFCEIWAEIFNLLFCLFTSRTGKCSQFSERRFRHALFREQLFSIYQSNKLLRRAGFQYSELFEPAKKLPYKENTNALSYYVLKSALIWNIDAFIQWTKSKSGGMSPIQFPANNVAEYCDLVIKSATTANYIDAVKSGPTYTLNARSDKDKTICGKELERTMRMSTIDQDWTFTI